MKTKWVLIVNVNPGAPAGGSGTQYFCRGTSTGDVSNADQEVTLWMDFGKDNYAGVTWNNAPDERRILIGWMNKLGSMPMKFPRKDGEGGGDFSARNGS